MQAVAVVAPGVEEEALVVVVATLDKLAEAFEKDGDDGLALRHMLRIVPNAVEVGSALTASSQRQLWGSGEA